MESFLYAQKNSYGNDVFKIKKRRLFDVVGHMEHLAGIEPVSLAWEAKVLPLNYRCTSKKAF